MKILVVHEVNYLTKIIYEFQILPEVLSILGHDVTIVDYNDSWKKEPGGSATVLKGAVHRNVHRAYPNAAVTVRRPGMLRLPLLSRISGALMSTVEIFRVLRDERPDVILLYAIPTMGLQTLVVARHFRIPVVFRAIDVTHELVPAVLVPAAKALEGIVFNEADLNIALTPHLRTYIESYGVSQSHIRLLPSGVDAGLFSPGPGSPEALARWGLGSADRVILFMGTIYKFSGLDRVIHDFGSLLRRHPTAALLIVGSGEDENRLRELVSEFGLAGRVVFTGLLPYAALPELIRSSEICINPFELNGITRRILPTKLFQYMTCEKAVLATELPGTLPFLSGETQGIVYSSLTDFNRKLGDLLDDPARMREIGRRGRETAMAYDWFAIARSLVECLEGVAA